MPTEQTSSAELGNIGYEIFVAALSVLSLVNIVLIAVLRDSALKTVVQTIDIVLSVIFLLDFMARLRRAPSKSGYFFRGFGWADLLASLPFPEFKILRIFRLIRVVRLLRIYGVRNIVRTLLRDTAGSALFSLLFVAVMMMEFGSLSILHIEKSAEGANITTASDALWYVLATMSTVGYGDQYPITTHGRELGAIVIVIGVAIFGTLTGYLANAFLAPKDPPAAEADLTAVPAAHDGAAAHDGTAAQLQGLKDLIEQQRVAIQRLEESIRGAESHASS
jgi:voltage-gated potassium channel